MADLETIVLQLQADVEDAQHAFESFASGMESQFSELERSVNEHFDGVKEKATETADHVTKEGKRAGEGFRTGIEVALGTLGLTFIMSLRRAFDEGMRMTEQFKTLSAITGDAAPRLMQLQFALTQLGIPAENVRTILTMMEAHIGRAGIQANAGVGPIHALGLSLKELENKDAITQLEIIADRFTKLGPQAQKAGAQMLFGFRGEVLLPLLQQGSEGIKRLIDAFKPPDTAVFAAFERLNMDMQALHMTWLSFSMEILKPVVDMMIRATEAATGFINKLRELPAASKMELLLGGLAAATVSFEILTTLIGSFLVQSAEMRGFIVLLQSFGGAISVIAFAAVALAVGWRENWGNMRAIVASTMGDIKDHVSDFITLWQYAVSLFNSEVLPAVKQLVVAIADGMHKATKDILDNNNVWMILRATLKLVADALTLVINLLTFLVDHFGIVGEIAVVAFAIRAAPAVLAFITKLDLITTRIAFLILDIGAWANATVTAMAEASLAGEGFLGVLNALRLGILALLAEIPVIGWITLAIIALGTAIVAVVTHLTDLEAAWGRVQRAIEGADRAIANWLSHQAELRAQGDPIKTILSAIADQFKRGADEANREADAMDRITQKADNLFHAGGGGHFHGGASGSWDSVTKRPPTPPGSQQLLPDVPKAKDAMTDFLDSIKDKMVPFQIALNNAQTSVKLLEEQLKGLDTIDTPAKLHQATKIWGEEMGALANEWRAQGELIRLAGKELDVVNAKLAAGGLSAKDRYALDQEKVRLNSEINAGYVTQAALQNDIHKIEKDRYDTAIKLDEMVAGDTMRSWAERIRAAWDEYNVSVYRKYSQDEINKKLREALDLQTKSVDSQVSLAEAAATAAEAKAKYEAAAGGPAATTAGTTEETGALFAEWKADLIASDDALKKWQAAQDALNKLQSEGIKSGEDYDNAVKAVSDAMKTYYTTLTTSIDAQRKYTDSLNYGLDTVYKNLDAFAKQVGGPVYTAFEALANLIRGQTQLAMVSLSEMFLQLFQKTLAYKDVEVTIMEVTTALAKILNTLRPIIDFFLGVLIGVTNVFISMYDVLATILDVFGAMITKIKLLNSDLQNMNVAAVPLIKIIHDLPTLPEFNRGYWTQLIGQQDAMNNSLNNLNSDILTGFDKTMSKLGEIVGILIAIKFLLGMMGVNLLGSNQSWFSAIANWWNRMFPTSAPPAPGGGATVAAAAPGSAVGAAFGAVGSSASNPVYVYDAQTAGLTENLVASTDNAYLTAANTSQTAANTGAHAATGVSTLGLIGKVASGIGDLYGVVSGYLSGGPMGGVEAGLGASGLMSLLAPAFAAGPYGIAAAAAIGLGAMLFGGHFGPNPANEPDVYNTSTWGQLNANLWGAGVGQFSNMPMMAAGQAFSMSSSLAQATGGMGLLQFIAAFMQSGSGLNVLGPRLASIFSGLSTTSTDVISGKNGILDLLNGVQMNFQQLYTTSYSAFQLIEKYLNGATAGASQFSNAMNINLAEVYGPHTAARGGGAAGAVAVTNPLNMTVNFNGNNYALNGEEVYNQLKPVFQQLLTEYQQQQALYTRSTPFAFSRGLSYS